jgi:DNA-binding MarR family transcriptional regulator
MTINLESGNLVLGLWFIMHRIADLLRNGEDRVFGEYEITTEQYSVLVTIKYLKEPARITDIARWLERSTNSVSMIVDRMVKAGLITRKRDKIDRRVVHVTITSKGEKALKPATLAGLEFIQKILSPLPYDDRRTLLTLLETVKYEALKYLNPEEATEEMRRNEAKRHADLMERLIQYCCPQLLKPNASSMEVERLVQNCCPQLLESTSQGGKKGKTIRRG